MSTLIAALRERYKTPADVLRALDLDPSLLNPKLAQDSKPKENSAMSKNAITLTRKGAVTMGALVGFLKPKLAQDAAINFYPALKGLTSKNYSKQKPHIAAEITKQCKGQMAKDASIDGLVELLDSLEKVDAGDAGPMEPNAGLPMEGEEEDGMDADVHAGLRAFLEEKGMDPADIEKACAMIGEQAGDENDPEGVKEKKLGGEKEADKMAAAKDKRGAKDEPPPFKGKPEVGGGMSKDEVNKAIKVASDAAVSQAVARVQKQMAGVREAERFVRPWVGELAMAHDSASEVYKTALTALGVDITDVDPSAFKVILSHMPVPSAMDTRRELAQDSALMTPSNDFASRFPEAAAVKFA